MLIAGAGIAGCATAIAIGRRRPDLTVWLAGVPHGRPPVGESIPPDTRPLLGRLGLLPDFLAEGHRPCLGSAASWGSDELGYNDFLTNPYGTGWHLDRQRFERLLLRRAGDASRLLTGRTTRTVRRRADDMIEFELIGAGQSPSTGTARFVVDATGAGAAIARRLGARTRRYDQLVLATAFFQEEPGRPRPGYTLVEAVRDGWWYLAGLPDNRLAVAFASDPEQIRALDAARWPAWVQLLADTRHVGPRLAGARLLSGELTVLGASSRRLDPPAGPGWLAVGDAACSYDPLSAQGIHQALHSALLASQAIDVDPLAPGLTCSDYAGQVVAEFEQYLGNQGELYAAEQRFAHAPFWRRRHAARAVLA